MKMVRMLSLLALVLLLGLATVALAHGQPVIALSADVMPAGGTITVTGSEMEAGEVFTITLEGVGSSVKLGDATVTAKGDEGGFVASFAIPANTPPGSYQVRARSGGGETASADLTVTGPSDQASAAPATIREATGEQHVLDRSKPVVEVAGMGIVAVLSLALGLVLARSHE